MKRETFPNYFLSYCLWPDNDKATSDSVGLWKTKWCDSQSSERELYESNDTEWISGGTVEKNYKVYGVTGQSKRTKRATQWGKQSSTETYKSRLKIK